MYQLLVSTRKGLLIGRSDDRRDWTFDEPHFIGWQIDYAVRDPRHGRLWVAASHMQWGPHLHISDDDGATWHEAAAPAFHGETYNRIDPDKREAPAQDTAASMDRIWTIEPGQAGDPGLIYAGVDPAALFVSQNNGDSWQLCDSLWSHDTRPLWEPGAAGLALHHIQIDPADPNHIYVSISAAGVFETTDRGASWTARNVGCTADHLPNPNPEAGQCVHSLHPARSGRLFQQHHPGMYRSDDGAATWIDIPPGLPGEFGFASTIDPNHADTFYVVPLEFDQARVPAEGKLRVYRTQDAGNTWQPLGDGLPQRHVLQGAYRQALCNDAAPQSATLGLYLGTSGVHLYASANGGEQWSQLLDHLAPVTAVRCAEMT